MRHSPTTTTWSSAPTAARPITGPAGRRSGPASTQTSTAPALSGCRTRRRKPRRKIWGSASAPDCGAHNPADGRFCNHCGTPLGQDYPPRQQGAANGGPVYTRPGGPQASGGAGGAQGATNTAPQLGPGFAGIYRRELRPDDTIDGIKAKDWASFLGPSSLSYLAQFVRMDELKRKFSVSLSAFFLGRSTSSTAKCGRRARCSRCCPWF